MNWTVELADEFELEYNNLPNEVQDELLAMTRLLQRFGAAVKTTTRRYDEWLPAR